MDEPGKAEKVELVEDRHARPESPNDPLEVLAAEQEGTVLLVIGKFRLIFEPVSLSPLHIEPVLERAVEQEHRDAVHSEESKDPTPGQGLHDFHIRKHEKRIG